MTGITLPWASDSAITSEFLDLEFHGNISGRKIVSPLVTAILESAETYTGVLTTAQLHKLCGVMWAKYHIKWSKLYATLTQQYNPIENYSMTETHTGTDTDLDTPTNWTETSQGLSADNESQSSSSVYGFNSSSAVPSAAVQSSVKNKQTKQQSGTYEKKTTHNTTLTRSGNIGVTTSQQMIESERQLWLWDYFGQVFKDASSIFVLDIY